MKSRRNKIFIVTECPYSGILRAIIHQATILKQMNFQVCFVIPIKARDRYGERQDENEVLLKKLGTIFHVQLRRKYRYLLSDKAQFKNFFINKKNCVVLSYTGYAGKICRLLFRDGVIKTLYHVPQCIDLLRRSYWQKIIERRFENFLSPHCTGYLACGPEECFALANEYKVDSAKIIFMPNFLSKNYWQKRFLKKKQFVVLGRVSKDKKVENVLFAASILGLLKYFCIIGDGDELVILKKRYPEATFLGRVTNAEAGKILRHSRFFISASIIEGMPFSLLEAMSYGVVPLVSDVPGHRDVIINGYTGFLFSGNNELADFIFKLHVMADTDYYEQISSHCRVTVQNMATYSIATLKNNFSQYE